MSSGNIKKFEVRLGRTGMIIVVAGMAVLLCGSFILGVTVGKNIDTYPEKISSTPQRMLYFFWRPAKVADQQNAAAAKEANAGKGEIDLAFHNTLTASKTLPIQPAPVAEKVPDQEAALPVAAETKVQKEESAEKQENMPVRKEAVAEKPVAAHKPPHKEENATTTSSGSSFFLHVASLKDKSKAEQINKAVSDMGYKSKVVKTDVNGKGIWYRVIATGFETKPQAKSAADKISKKVKSTCIIRQTNINSDKNH